MNAKHEARIRSYRRKRAELINSLGGRCEICRTTEKLEFDHINDDRDWEARKVSRWVRIARYAREEDQGRIQLLCRSCNAKKRTTRSTSDF